MSNGTKCQGKGYNEYADPCFGYARTEIPCWQCAEKCREAGFTESDSLASDDAIEALHSALKRPDFPVTVTVHTLDGKNFTIPGIREESITLESRKGRDLLVMERDGTDEIVYVPNVAYWATV